MKINILIVYLFMKYLNLGLCFPEKGKWTISNEKKQAQYHFGISKSLYKDSTVSIKVGCDPVTKIRDPLNITIGWVLRQTPCYEEYVGAEVFKEEYLAIYYNCPWMTFNVLHREVRFLIFDEVTFECNHAIPLLPPDKNFTMQIENTSGHPECSSGQFGPLDRSQNKEIDMSKGTLLDTSSHAEKSGDLTQLDQSGSEHSLVKRDAGSNNPNIVQSEGAAAMKKAEQSNNKQEKPAGDKNKETQKTATTTTTTKQQPGKENKASEASQDKKNPSTKENTETTPVTPSFPKSKDYQGRVDKDGMYLLVIYVASTDGSEFNLTIDVEMKGRYGYLSAVDWPLLPFYGVMCGIYVIYAVAWLVVTALQWRDLLRIQFWIGGVIFLGLVEKAVLYAEYQSLNESGESVKGAIIFAELLSSLKRTLARMLVIIVSLGFGIVKPRLGPLLHRVVGVGALYFILSAIEGCLRSLKMKNDPSNQTLIAGVPLAVMDSAICWWIFSSLVQTTRTLQLRRNLVKFSLYKHFTNTLIFAVLASIGYMVWSIHSHKFTSCITDWKELWVDDAYWHFLFSIILLVIMILWRPTNNNQRYAFTPLLDAEDDDDDEIKDHALNNDAFGMKMRGAKGQVNVTVQKDNKNKEDDLKWAEENIPPLPETALPSLLDSDEEIMTAKFERNKME